jgi:hypothetical protein
MLRGVYPESHRRTQVASFSLGVHKFTTHVVVCENFSYVELNCHRQEYLPQRRGQRRGDYLEANDLRELCGHEKKLNDRDLD